MATDFFDRQDHARRLTRRLVVMFVLSVAAIILAIYLVVALALGAESQPMAHHAVEAVPAAPSLWNPVVFLWVTLGTVLVVATGSLYKISELSAGGEQIALMMGGTAINPQTTDLAERRLLNVVEEMALAAGIPVPPVYVLANEPGINAFAAGHQPADAVVAVSAGCLQYLTREELQGVMGHEFSHILNGDMRLNLRLIGIVYGILVLAILGYYLLRSAPYVSSGRDRNEGAGAAMAMMVLGLAMLILGYLGVFFGNLIKAAISRQREFLADASSVQFTRLPSGIAGALKKIGGLDEGSRIHDAHATEISHMFFGDAFAGAWFNLFATHPPLEVRIRALDPTFDGRFPEVRPLSQYSEDSSTEKTPPHRNGGAFGGGQNVARSLATAAMVQHIGQPQVEHLQRAGQMLSRIPQPLADAAREPFSAQAVIYLLLISRDAEATRTKQWQLLDGQIEPTLYQEMQRLAAAAQDLPAEARLPVADLAIPALKRLSPPQYARFRQIVDLLVNADGTIDLFEYCLHTMLFSYLDVHFGLKKPPAVRYRTTAAVAQPLTALLSVLADIGQQRPEDAQRAFQAGVQGILNQATMLPKEQCTLRTFNDALAELAQASPTVKRDVIASVTACIAADGRVTLEESELLRAIAAVLACPIPPSLAAA